VAKKRVAKKRQDETNELKVRSWFALCGACVVVMLGRLCAGVTSASLAPPSFDDETSFTTTSLPIKFPGIPGMYVWIAAQRCRGHTKKTKTKGVVSR
jgi:hypothetical protein